MKRFLLLFAAVLSASAVMAQTTITSADSLAFINADWNISYGDNGAEVKSAVIPMFGGHQSVFVISYPIATYETAIIVGEGFGKDIPLTVDKRGLANHSDITSALGKASGAEYAINGNYFNMKTRYLTCYTRLRGGYQSTPTSPSELNRVNGAIGIRRGGKKLVITEGCNPKKHYPVMMAGPVLILDGEDFQYDVDKMDPKYVSNFYSKRHPRTIVGYTGKGGRKDRVCMIVIDGRVPGKADGASIPECTAISRYLGLSNSLNLDGGGSTTIWSEDHGVLNHPSDYGEERIVPTVLIAR